MYGGNNKGGTTNTTNITINDGNIATVYGGGDETSVINSTNVIINNNVSTVFEEPNTFCITLFPILILVVVAPASFPALCHLREKTSSFCPTCPKPPVCKYRLRFFTLLLYLLCRNIARAPGKKVGFSSDFFKNAARTRCR